MPDDALVLLLQALTDDRQRRRLIGRLHPAVTGWHYPKRRMARLPWKGIRPASRSRHERP